LKGCRKTQVLVPTMRESPIAIIPDVTVHP
jgi:hypothetical protein